MPSAGPTVFRAHRLRVYVEPAGSFAQDHTGTLNDFVDVPLAEGSHQLTITQETHNPLHARQNMLDYQEEILGKKAWSLSFTTPLYPTGVAAASGVTATAGAIHTMLKAVMGGEFRGTGSTASGAWSTAGGGNVAAGTGFRAGGIAGWADSSGIVHFRPVKSRSSNALALKVRFPGVPASGDVIYSGATYFWTQDPDTSLQFIVEGSESDDRWVVMGGQGTVTPQLALDGTIQTLQWQITGVDWLYGDDAAGSFSGALGNATYTNYEPITGQSGRAIVRTNGVIAYTGASVCINELAMTPGVAYQPISCPSGVQGVLRHRLVRPQGTPVAQGTFSTFYETRRFHEDRDAKRDSLVFYQSGVSAGRVAALDVPTVQFTDVQMADQDGISGEQVTYKARLDGDTSGTSAEIAFSPQRWHFG